MQSHKQHAKKPHPSYQAGLCAKAADILMLPCWQFDTKEEHTFMQLAALHFYCSALYGTDRGAPFQHLISGSAAIAKVDTPFDPWATMASEIFF